MSTTTGRIADLKNRLANLDSAQRDASEKQRAKGKNGAMDRIKQLVDPGTGFTEIDKFRKSRDDGSGAKRPDRDAVIIGVGTVHGLSLIHI